MASNYRVAQNKLTHGSLFKFVTQHRFDMSQNLRIPETLQTYLSTYKSRILASF